MITARGGKDLDPGAAVREWAGWRRLTPSTGAQVTFECRQSSDSILTVRNAAGTIVSITVPREGFWDEADTYFQAAPAADLAAAAEAKLDYQVLREHQLAELGSAGVDYTTAGIILGDFPSADQRINALRTVLASPARTAILQAISQNLAERLNLATHLGTTWSDRAIDLHAVTTILAAVTSVGAAGDLFAMLAGRRTTQPNPFAAGWPDALAAIGSRTGLPDFAH